VGRRRPLLAEIQDASRPAPANTTRHSHAGASAQSDERVSEDDVVELLRAEVASTLGYGSAADIRVDQNFTELGLDSLMAAELASRIESRVGVRCSRAVFDHPSVEALTAYLQSERPLTSKPAPAVFVDQRVVTGGEAFQGHWIKILDGMSPDARLETLTSLVREEVARTLGFAGAADVRVDQSFTDLGMDSLMAAEFVARLRSQLGVRDTGSVFDHPFVPALAEHLLGLIDAGASAARPAGSLGTPGVVLYTPERDREVIEFHKTAFPSRRRDLIEPRWRWMFLESASRLTLPPRVWLFADQDRIVGHNGAIPVRLKIGPEERVTAWFVDTMVLEAWRAQAVGSRLMMQAHEDHPFALSLGQTAEMRRILLHLGWQQVAPLQFALTLIRPGRVLKGKLPGPAALAVTFGLRASHVVRDLRRLRPRGELREVALFERRHDELWRLAARDLTCSVTRDASYLNWKYVSQPGQQFLRLELVEDDRALGVVVLMFREPDATYKYTRAFVVDLVAPLGDAPLLGLLLRAAREAAAGRGADSLICLHVNARLTMALRRSGFTLRSPTRFLLVRPGSLAGDLRKVILDADQWFVTHGDSDIDRP
jgi:acyl carrier protein